jgi:cell division protein ZapA
MVPLPRPLGACYGPDMAPRRAVELRVGGQTYRVVATDDDLHVQHLAELVDRKYAEVVPQGGRGVTAQQGIFLTALALAHEVEEQRARAARLEVERDRFSRLAARAKESVTRLLQRVDSALSPAPPASAVAGATGNGSKGNSHNEASVSPAPSLSPSDSPLLDHDTHLEDEPATPAHDDRAARANPRVEPGVPTRDERPVRRRPHDAARELLFEVLPATAEVEPSVPRDVCQALPREVQPSLPRDVEDEIEVPRAPRGPLRLVRQSSSPDDESR